MHRESQEGSIPFGFLVLLISHSSLQYAVTLWSKRILATIIRQTYNEYHHFINVYLLLFYVYFDSWNFTRKHIPRSSRDERFFKLLLTIHVPRILGTCIKIKFNLNFYFHTSLWCLKSFYEGL